MTYPEDWEVKKLGECCIILDNKRKPVSGSVRVAGKYPYYGANGILDYVSSYIFDGVYVLVGEDGSVITPNGNPVVTWAEGKIWVNNHAHVVQEKEGTSLRYLFYALQTINISELIHGNIPKFTGRDLRNLQIPIPPLPEQQAIADTLTVFDTHITNLANLIAKKKAIRDGALDDLMSARTRLKGFSGQWEVKKLGELGVVKMCRRIFQEQTRPVGQIPFYKIGTFGGEADAYITRELYEKYKSLYPYPKIGDVLLSAAGTIGRAVIFDGKDSYFQDSNIVWLDVNHDVICNKFLYYFYRSCHWHNIEGTTINRLYNSIILDTPINLPPLPEQQAIADTLTAFDDEINALESERAKIIQIRDGAMNDLLTGKVRLLHHGK